MLDCWYMKQRSTTTVSNSLAAKAALVAVAVMVAAAGVFQTMSPTLARDFDAEIRAKEQEAKQYKAEANRLGKVANSLQGALSELKGQISSVQGQINKSQKKYNKLIKQIDQNKQKIDRNRKTLGLILSDMYVDDQISPLEMLASSDNIGDFIDKQERRSSLRYSLNEKIKDIKTLQKKLEKDKKSVENILKDQKSQRALLASKQGEQTKLLNQTNNDKNAYKKLAAQKNAEIGRLRVEQRKSNCQAMGGIWTSDGSCVSGGGGSGAIPPPSSGNGGYPAVWANAPMDSLVDNWGMYNRECVSYVAWKIAASGRRMPYWGGRGHAYQWPGNAQGAGIPTGSTPKAGAAAVMYGGPYGHIMYVEAVNGNGTITVSDYNLGVDGLYRYYTRSASGLTYIYF